MHTLGKWLLCTLLLLPAGLARGQDDASAIKKKINEIKRDRISYLYAETTAATESEAKNIAEEMLYEEINEWVATKKKFKDSSNIIVNNQKSLWTSVSLQRGDMYRWFTYVKKSDIIASDNATIIESVAGDETEAVAAKDVPAAVQRVAGITEYSVLASTIEQMKSEGQISYYARYAQLDNPSLYYLAVYNTAGKVVAVLTAGEQRTNVRTGKQDDVKNYKGCGAIGFSVK